MLWHMASDRASRSVARSIPVAFRVTSEERDEVKQKAADAGMTLQEYLYERALGRPCERRSPGRPPSSHRDTELPYAM